VRLTSEDGYCKIQDLNPSGPAAKSKRLRPNDRIVAVELENHSYADIKHVDDLGKEFVQELEEFFVNYHRMLGKTYSIVAVKGPREARRREGSLPAIRHTDFHDGPGRQGRPEPHA